MSVKAMTWVFDNSTYKLGARLVHIALADIANDEHDNELWMYQWKLAEKTLLSVKQVSRVLAQMVADGSLELLEQGGGRGKPSRYRLITETGQIVGVSDWETRTSSTGNADIDDRETRTSAESLCLLTQVRTQRTQAALPKTRKRPIPDVLPVTDAVREWARNSGRGWVDLEAQTALMLDWHRREGKLAADWEAARRTWLGRISPIDPAKQAGARLPAKPSHPCPHCAGEGRIIDDDGTALQCQSCSGSGRASLTEAQLARLG